MAPLGDFRKLREDLVIVPQETPEGVLYIVKDPEARTYFKFDEKDYAVVRCFRGAGSLKEVITRFAEANPGTELAAEAAREYGATLAEMGLLERTLVERNLMVMEKMRDARRKKAAGRAGGNIFFITFPAIDPNRLMDRVHPYIRFFWQPWFVVLSLAGMAIMFGIFALRWDQIFRSTLEFYNFREKTTSDIFEFLALMFVLVGIHEFAHGMTCKHFGGEVHEIGFVLFYFTPAFYCDVNDAYIFPKKSHKVWVTVAGVYSELLACVLATIGWLASRPDSALNDLSYKVILYTGLSSIAFNINPLVKLDGYYLLMDWLEIPNLRERAFDYLGYLFRSRILRLEVERPVTTRRQRRIFVLYGVLAACYTTLILVLLFGLAWNWLGSLFPGLGFAMALVLIIGILRKRLVNLRTILTEFFMQRRKSVMTRRAWVMVSGGAVTALALLVFPRLPSTVRSRVFLEPERVVHLSARSEGVIERVLAGEGEAIRRGERVAVLRNEELGVRLRKAERQRALADLQARARRSEGKTAEGLEAQRRSEELTKRVEELRRKADSLEIRSPIDGILLTPRVEDLVGTYRTAGEPILELGISGSVRARVRVSEWDLRWVAMGQEVQVRLDALPFRSFRGRVQAIAPAGSDVLVNSGARSADGAPPYRVFDVGVLLDNSEGVLRPGMAGTAKISVRPRSIGGRLFRAASELVRSVFW